MDDNMRNAWLDMISKVYTNLHNSDRVLRASNVSDKKRERLLKYFERLEELHNKVSKTKNVNGEKLLKSFYYDLYVIKPENIPDAYFQNQVRLARERGYGNIELTEEDKRVILVLRDMLRKYPNIVENNRRLKAAIADILPGRRREVNLLGMLAEENIVRAIETKNSLDQVLCDRFASVLEEEYGTSMELARRMVLIWFHAYGRLILNKNID